MSTKSVRITRNGETYAEKLPIPMSLTVFIP